MRWIAFIIAGLLPLSLPSVSFAAACDSVFFASSATELDLPPGGERVLFADMDGNGAYDWLVSRPFELTLQLRNRDGSLLTSTTYTHDVDRERSMRQFAVADVTGDGQLDVVVRDTQRVFVLQQTSGNLTHLGYLDITPSDPASQLLLAAGNFLSPSQADIVVETAPGEMQLFHASEGVFRAIHTLTDVAALDEFVTRTTEMVARDVDDDGLQDLLYPAAGGVAIAQRTASGSFQPVHRLAMDGGYQLGAFGDFDGNGLQDVAVIAREEVAPADYKMLLHTWLQAPAGTFTPLEPEERARGSGRMLTADLSGDGADELVVGSFIGQLVERQWTFTERNRSEYAPEALLDLTGDGLLDLVNSTYYEPSVAPGVRTDLAIEIVDAPALVRSGDDPRLMLSVTNRSSTPSQGMTLSADGGESGQVKLSCGVPGECSVPGLGAGESRQFVATLNVGEGEHVDLSVSVCSRLVDADASNNGATLRIPIDNEVRADLHGDVSIVIEDSDIMLIEHVRNDGPSTATRVRLEQDLPEGMVGVTWTSDEGVDCAVQAGKLSCEVAEMPKFNGWSITVRGKLDYRGQRVETWATVTSDAKDPDESNNRFGRVIPEGFLGGVPRTPPDGDGSSGCGCRLVASPSSAPPQALWLALAAAAALGLRRIRRS
ncbi:FG-GAP-like repeat-containing protein [Sorangium sp. So ce185]|uniref:FG-GAP-like repeat-containing protein n=1 Tax=Sorangium sp. So ce185 TaxID=3133287 RepID=UPI003F647E9F